MACLLIVLDHLKCLLVHLWLHFYGLVALVLIPDIYPFSVQCPPHIKILTIVSCFNNSQKNFYKNESLKKFQSTNKIYLKLEIFLYRGDGLDTQLKWCCFPARKLAMLLWLLSIKITCMLSMPNLSSLINLKAFK